MSKFAATLGLAVLPGVTSTKTATFNIIDENTVTMTSDHWLVLRDAEKWLPLDTWNLNYEKIYEHIYDTKFSPTKQEPGKGFWSYLGDRKAPRQTYGEFIAGKPVVRNLQSHSHDQEALSVGWESAVTKFQQETKAAQGKWFNLSGPPVFSFKQVTLSQSSSEEKRTKPFFVWHYPRYLGQLTEAKFKKFAPKNFPLLFQADKAIWYNKVAAGLKQAYGFDEKNIHTAKVDLKFIPEFLSGVQDGNCAPKLVMLVQATYTIAREPSNRMTDAAKKMQRARRINQAVRLQKGRQVPQLSQNNPKLGSPVHFLLKELKLKNKNKPEQGFEGGVEKVIGGEPHWHFFIQKENVPAGYIPLSEDHTIDGQELVQKVAKALVATENARKPADFSINSISSGVRWKKASDLVNKNGLETEKVRNAILNAYGPFTSEKFLEIKKKWGATVQKADNHKIDVFPYFSYKDEREIVLVQVRP